MQKKKKKTVYAQVRATNKEAGNIFFFKYYTSAQT